MKGFMDEDVSLKRWRLYLLRFGLMVFAWAALRVGFLALITDASVRVFVLPEFVFGMAVAFVVSIAIYGVETKSKGAKISIVLVLVALAVWLVVDRIRSY